MRNKVYQRLASIIQAQKSCEKTGNAEWADKWADTIEAIMRTSPSGSGINSGTRLDMESSNSEKLVFKFGFHHMNENGYYDGWTEHKAVVTGSLPFGYSLHVTGRNRNGIKDYLHEVFSCWINEEIDY